MAASRVKRTSLRVSGTQRKRPSGVSALSPYGLLPSAGSRCGQEPPGPKSRDAQPSQPTWPGRERIVVVEDRQRRWSASPAWRRRSPTARARTSRPARPRRRRGSGCRPRSRSSTARSRTARRRRRSPAPPARCGRRSRMRPLTAMPPVFSRARSGPARGARPRRPRAARRRAPRASLAVAVANTVRRLAAWSSSDASWLPGVESKSGSTSSSTSAVRSPRPSRHALQAHRQRLRRRRRELADLPAGGSADRFDASSAASHPPRHRSRAWGRSSTTTTLTSRSSPTGTLADAASSFRSTSRSVMNGRQASPSPS